MSEIGEVKLIGTDGSEVLLSSFPFTIGSFRNVCSLWIDSDSISPIHCQIVKTDSGYAVEDLNSKLGVEVNGLLLDPNTDYAVSDGDTIKIGDKKYTFSLLNELLTENEVLSLNENFKKILDNPVGEISLAENSIETLIKKALDINRIAFGEDTEKFRDQIKSLVPGLESVKESFEETFTSYPETPVFEEDQISLTLEPEIHHEPNSRMVEIDPNLFDNLSGIDSNTPKEPEPPKERIVVLREQEPPYTEIKITKTPFKIGRSSQLCDFILDRRGVSRSHATIMRDEHDTGYIIRDNNAVNGTFINNHQLIGNESALALGDIIKLYDYEFKVVQVD